jgi:hypothetical protein
MNIKMISVTAESFIALNFSVQEDASLLQKVPAHLKAPSVHACGTSTDRGTKATATTLEREAAARRQDTTAHVADSQRSSGPAVQNERARR